MKARGYRTPCIIPGPRWCTRNYTRRAITSPAGVFRIWLIFTRRRITGLAPKAQGDYLVSRRGNSIAVESWAAAALGRIRDASVPATARTPNSWVEFQVVAVLNFHRRSVLYASVSDQQTRCCLLLTLCHVQKRWRLLGGSWASVHPA